MQLTITSTQNPRIKAIRELRLAGARQETGLYLAEGEKLVAEAIRDGQVTTLLVDDTKTDHYAPLLARVQDVLLCPPHVIAAASETKTPQGILAAVRIPPPFDLDTAFASLLILDGVQDPGNVGTMFRTAEAAGFSAALLSPTCADAFAPKTVRATMGSILRLPIWRGALSEALSFLKARGYTAISTELGGAPFYKAIRRIHGPIALIIGSEGQGVSEAISALADVKVALPMHGRAESLNAAVAAGILMYGITESQG